MIFDPPINPQGKNLGEVLGVSDDRVNYLIDKISELAVQTDLNMELLKRSLEYAETTPEAMLLTALIAALAVDEDYSINIFLVGQEE